MKWYDVSSVSVGTVGTISASINIDLIFNRILLVLSILNILVVLAFKIYDKIKDRKLTKDEMQEIANDVNTAKDEIEQTLNNEKKEDK